MKKFIISEEEKSRILGLHKNAILNEQATPTGQTQQAGPTTVKLTGNAAAALQSVPNIILKPGTEPNRPFLQTNGLETLLVNYLGGQQSNYYSSVLNKQILVFKNKGASLSISSILYFDGSTTASLESCAFLSVKKSPA